MDVSDASLTDAVADADGFTKVTRKNKKSNSLAVKSRTGLSNAIGKAGKTSKKRVHGQCDYYTAALQCPRGTECRLSA